MEPPEPLTTSTPPSPPSPLSSLASPPNSGQSRASPSPDGAPYPSPSSSFRPPPPDLAPSHDASHPSDDVDARRASKPPRGDETRDLDEQHGATTTTPPPPDGTHNSLSASTSHPDPAPPSTPGDGRVIIRDFAFPVEDPRYHGAPHVEEERRPGSPTSDSEAEDDERGSTTPGGHAGAGQIVGNQHFASSGSSVSWGFVTSHQADFPASEDDSPAFSEPDFSDDAPSDEENELLPDLVPGRYVAQYDFAKELDAEMDIAKGESVHVLSRECDGWVLAVRLNPSTLVPTSERGLVPENYLQFHSPSYSLPPTLFASPMSTPHEWHDSDNVSDLADEEDSVDGRRGKGGRSLLRHVEVEEDEDQVATPRPILSEDGDEEDDDEESRRARDETPSASIVTERQREREKDPPPPLVESAHVQG